MGLMDLLNTEEGRFNLGLLAAAAPRAQRTGFGERMQDVVSGVDAWKAQRTQAEMAALEKQRLQMALDEAKQAMADKALARTIAGRNPLPGSRPQATPQPAAPAAPQGVLYPPTASLPPTISTQPILSVPRAAAGPGGAQPPGQPVLNAPGASQAPSQGISPRAAMYQYYVNLANEFSAAGLSDHARAAMEQAEKLRPKYSTEPRNMMVNGKLTPVLVNEDGEFKTMDGVGVKPDYVESSNGAVKYFVDRNDPNARPVGVIPMQMSPAERDASARGWASNTRENEGTWTFNSDVGGMVNNRTGKIKEPIGPDGRPIAITPKTTEDQSKAAGWLLQAGSAYKAMLAAIDPAQGGDPRAQSPTTKEAAVDTATFGRAEGLTNATRSAARQKFVTASSSLSEALLRAATGAGINIFEAKQKIAEITPQYYDKPETVQYKMSQIPLFLEGLKVRAGANAKAAEQLLRDHEARNPPPAPAAMTPEMIRANKILSRAVQGGG